MNERKKWCEVCKMLIPYTRSAIQDHENTAKHKKNKEYHLREQNKKARIEHKSQNKAYDSIPQTSKGFKNQNQKKEEHNYHQAVENEYTGENQQQQTKVADQLGFFAEGKVWILEKEDDTGRLRFRNTITGTINYEKPMGLMLEDYEEEAWEEYQQNPVENVDKELVVKVGQWEVVKTEDAFLNKFKVETSESEEGQAELNHEEQLAEKIEQDIKGGTIKNQQELVKEVLIFGQIGKDKNRILQQKLIELADKDVELKDILPQMQQKNNKNEEINTAGLFNKKSFKKTKVDYFQ
ncbi:unnamed protein product (macronuclear) [Paramecium tetraurelia]|uniref:U1-type domain-containing protein n=1 Tax=Paramecium tetraurelia TaxID=5888 RepID=A0CVY5_PARTE|nr:uncharacterized protein GSPATT00001154001 [Paramecium tetraurelia]CAK74952.1 unnamed protein product [Paramecium tetraurelia]|eukprot:XP_001442349.1 hypothetical protein (macronuclear) [Paramecium tetraurelia strain d4-2]